MRRRITYFGVGFFTTLVCYLVASVVVGWFNWPDWVAYPLSLLYLLVLLVSIVSWADSGTDNGHDERYYGGSE